MEDQRKSLTIDVSIKDTEVFKQFLGVVSKMVMDDRMPADLRGDAMAWFKGAGIHDREYAIFVNHTIKPMTTLDATGWPVKVAPYQAKEQIVILCETLPSGKAIWQHRKHRYNPDAKLVFIGKDSNRLDGLRPDKVVLLRGYEHSKGAPMTWLTRDGEKSAVIYEAGDDE